MPRSKQSLLNHTNMMLLLYYTQGWYGLYMIFVGKNKRIVLKMLTANSKNTNTMLVIVSRNIYDWLVAYYGILGHTHMFFGRCQLYCGIGVVDMGPSKAPVEKVGST